MKLRLSVHHETIRRVNYAKVSVDHFTPSFSLALPVYAEIGGVRFRSRRHAEPRLVMGVECGQAPHRLVACRCTSMATYAAGAVWFSKHFVPAWAPQQIRLIRSPPRSLQELLSTSVIVEATIGFAQLIGIRTGQ